MARNPQGYEPSAPYTVTIPTDAGLLTLKDWEIREIARPPDDYLEVHPFICEPRKATRIVLYDDRAIWTPGDRSWWPSGAVARCPLCGR
jgi:hypothetical protein